MSGIEEMASRYIEYKQALGFDFAGEAQRLRAFAAFLGGDDATEESALAWACSGAGHPRSYQAQRYETVRRFSGFAHALTPAFPAMRPGLLGRTSDRVVPYIYSEEDACLLMRAALSEGSPDGLRGEGLSFLIGLMWSCGLRIGEALGLEDADFDAHAGTLAVRDSKFGSSRTIPVSPGTAERIAGYVEGRSGKAGGRADRLGRRKAAQQGLCGRHVLGDPLDAHREGRGLLRKEAAPARPAPFVLRVDPAALACGRRGCERDDALPLGLCRAPQALGYLLVSDRRPRAHGSGGRLVPPRDADGGGPGMKDILPQLLKGFFLQWMAAGRQLSPETVASYRDAFSLMLRWFRDERGTDASEVGMDDLTAENVEEFLLYLAERRGNSAQTVNCRLAAIKAFCSYAAYRAPERLAEMKRISDIPRRTEKRREVGYLTQEEVGWLLDACDAASRRGQEDHLLLSLLFSTGARISEAVALRMRSFERRGGRLSVHLAGKGRKERTLPLWPEVAGEVTAFAEERQLGADDFVFPGRNVEHLSRSGARSRIDAAVRRASELHPALAGKRITPHVFRHSCAMAMLESGVDLSTIAIWLGHESVQTTHRYMVASMSRKEDALARVHPDSRQESGCRRYRAQGDILSFLESL
jgi:integrase/recombinase XerD